MTPPKINIVGLVLGMVGSLLLARGASWTAKAIQLTLEGVDLGVQTLARGGGPVFLGMDVHRDRAAHREKIHGCLGWPCLFASFAFQLAALWVS